MQKLGITDPKYHRMKGSACQKFIRAFGADEQVERLDERGGMSVYE